MTVKSEIGMKTKMAANESETCEGLLESTTVCSLCVKNVAKYTCPRCNIRYCSVECYRGEKHVNCSEEFYKNCVLEEIKEIKACPEDRAQILEMLRRTENDFGENESDNDDEVEDLEDRVAGLNLDDDTDELWQRLSDREKKEFYTMVRDGRLANLVEVWTPWWNVQESQLVSEVDNELPTKSTIPVIAKEISDFKNIFQNKNVSSDIRYNVINVLFSYVFVARLHNGGHTELAVESAETLLSVSEVLSTTTTFSTVGEAIHSGLTNINKLEKVREREKFHQFTISLLEDVKNIVTGPPNNGNSLLYTMAALSDVWAVITAAKQHVSKELKSKRDEKRTGNLKELKSKLFLADKKIQFLLSWCQRYGMALHPLSMDLDLEFCSLSSELSSVMSTKTKFEECWGGPKPPPKTDRLIEEISTDSCIER